MMHQVKTQHCKYFWFLFSRKKDRTFATLTDFNTLSSSLHQITVFFMSLSFRPSTQHFHSPSSFLQHSRYFQNAFPWIAGSAPWLHCRRSKISWAGFSQLHTDTNTNPPSFPPRRCRIRPQWAAQWWMGPTCDAHRSVTLYRPEATACGN